MIILKQFFVAKLKIETYDNIVCYDFTSWEWESQKH